MNLVHKLLKVVDLDLIVSGHVEENEARRMATSWSTLHTQWV